MAIGRSAAVGGALGLALQAGAVGSQADDQLLERFLRGGEDAGVAFEALVTRHGPMVLSACRRVLGASHDAEDAFQATFLILVRRAGAIRNRDSIGSWLHGVARRVAVRAREEAARRRARERRAGAVDARQDGGEADREDLVASLREEIARLPDKYREPVALCELGGLTHEQAARQLGWPVGTVSGRLSRARDLLRGGFARRGLASPAGVPALAAGLVARTTRAADLLGAGGFAGPGLPARAAALAEGVLKARLFFRLKAAAGLLLATGVAAGGSGGAPDCADRSAVPGSPRAVAATAEASGPSDRGPAFEEAPAAPGRRTAPRPPIVLGWHLDVTSLAIAPDGRTLASGSRDSTVKLWDLEAGTERATLRGHSAPILALAFSPDGDSLASADEGRTLKVWDVATGDPQLSLTWADGPPPAPGPVDAKCGEEPVRLSHQPAEPQDPATPGCSGA